MDRTIVYPGGIPLDTDLLAVNRNAMVALGALIGATLGTGTVIDGLEVTPTAPASMAVTVAPGSITQLSVLDQAAYGSLGADTATPLMKMGINLAPVSFTLTAPAAAGQSVVYLIQAAFLETDTDPVVLPYYNAADPSQPYLGPGNSGTAQATRRRQSVQLQLKAGAPALTGTQAPPPVDAGWTALALVLVSNGQTQIGSGDIVAVPGPRVPFKLPYLKPGFTSIAAFTASGTFVVPEGVTAAKVTVIGGGGAGGTHATQPAGGGGAGGRAIGVVTGLVAGNSVPVTVGGGGQPAGGPGYGGAGGTSSFGAWLSATGGAGGMGGSGTAVCAGAQGGMGVGGTVNLAGAYGTDADNAAGRGGDGGGPGNGRGSTGTIVAMAAPGYGGGGGGGGTAASGAAGGGGLVIVEY
jgi:hypothetical protein